MARHRPRILRFYEELRRRHVIKVLVAYLAAGFVLLQGVDILFPALAFPEWTVTFVVLLLILGLPVAAVLAWAYDLSPAGMVRTSRVDAENAAAKERTSPAVAQGPAAEPTRPAADPRSIVVLPLSNLSADGDDRYFSDGVTEDITANLAKLGELRVLSRTSAMAYRDSPLSAREIGQELGVAHVLEGSVRRQGQRVRIVAQLIDAASDRHLWAETYDRDLEDIFEIQGDVARRIARALGARLSSREEARITRRPTAHLGAYEAYLRGRHAWNARTPEGLAASIERLSEATRLDPEFSLAWSGLADSLIVQALYGVKPASTVMPRALESIERALALDPYVGEAFASRGTIHALLHWDWAQAEADLDRALELSPHYATAHQWRALHLLAPLRRFEEAHRSLERAHELDPVSSAIGASTGFVHLLEGRPDQAEAALRRVIDADPEFSLAHFFLGRALTERGDYEGAITALERVGQLRGGAPEADAELARAHAAAGREIGAMRDTLIEAAEAGDLSETRMAGVLVAAGEDEAALAWLERARDARSPEFVWIGSDPAFRRIAEHPRFLALLESAGLAR
jgi:TolB-like protein/Tfp pilus assembly protein PilF